LEFSTSLIKLIGSFLSQRKFSVSVEGEINTPSEITTPREIRAEVPQDSVLSHILCNMYINNSAPQTSGVYLALFADDTSLYATDSKEDFVVRKFQRCLSSMETWCEH
jgi:hypothetical protein